MFTVKIIGESYMDFDMFVAGCLFTSYCAEKERVLKLEGKEKMNFCIRFYRCKHCGKIIVIVNESGVPTICCGEAMDELKPSVADEGQEKHVPVIKQDGNLVIVSVGEKHHPMTKDHHIEWIVLLTDKGIQKRFLCPGDEPRAVFALIEGESIIGAYSYCNIHKLWKDS